ncbi:SDR family NAD(P)-dependent oxidoreductase [Streptomyces hyaluromycini]|uniref:SDR family NAD(P)-dependent oxidoreductase n=1 Tax=Streptomyces hyaluromycini TaxID=1377993 RepID=UPI000B5CE997|nr:SDR family NAD(P)-dependent oxidoreductase [Streptomyces hyaluromycini]
MQTKEILRSLREGRIGVEEARAALTADDGTPSPEGEERADIAIVGASGRYPGAANLGKYWDNLRLSKESIQEVPATRWDIASVYDPRPRRRGTTDCKWLGLLDGVDLFDADFFHITQQQARAMDPQQRLFLQEAFLAFGDAGYSRELLDDNNCGVYLGIAGNEYGALLARHSPDGVDATGNNAAIAAARIAYHFNLTGAALSVDTACTSSLVAVHLACEALLRGEIDMALAGGVSLYLGADRYPSMSAAGMLSRTGECRPFDNKADGFVPGEGVGAVVLKRLADAERDGDAIHAVIIGSAINQNGSTNGITAPSRKSQTKLVSDLYTRRRIDPAGIGYVECHATGTVLGDYIELDALSAVFAKSTDDKQFCAVGSVKGNIGHTTAAAGMAGLHKVLLCLQNRMLVPTPHQEEPNEYFDFASSPFYVATEAAPWPASAGRPRRAGVSAFGFSGSNAHLVVEEYVPRAAHTVRPGTTQGPCLFVLSAATREQLNAMARELLQRIRRGPTPDPASLAYTLQSGREAMEVRAAFPADSVQALLASLEDYLDRGTRGRGIHPIEAGRAAVRDTAQDQTRQWLRNGDLVRAAHAWVNGASFTDGDWRLLYGADTPRRAHLPTYVFAAQKYWLAELPAEPVTVTEPDATGAEVGPPSTFFHSDEPYVRDHTVEGVPTLIGMTHLSLAVDWYLGRSPHLDQVRLRKLRFLRPVAVEEGDRVEVRIEPGDPEASTVSFRAMYRPRPGQEWLAAAEGTVQDEASLPTVIDPDRLLEGLSPLDPEVLYGRNPAISIGDTFKTFTAVHAGDDSVVAVLDAARATEQDGRDHLLHPLFLYSAFQAALHFTASAGAVGYLPFGLEDLWVRRDTAPGPLRLSVRLKRNSGELIVFDADLVDSDSQVVASLNGCSMKRVREREPRPRPPVPVRNASRKARPSAGPDADIERYVTTKLAALLGSTAEEVQPHVNLMDLGATSAQLVSLTQEIEHETGLDLSPALLFEYPNVKELAAHFHQAHGDVFAAHLGATTTSPARDTEPPARGAQPWSRATEPATARLRPARSATLDAGAHDIAVIGMHGKAAGASDLDEFWRNLIDEKDVITEIPADRWDYRPWYDTDPEARDKTYCKWGSFLTDVDTFDADFFHISPREAEWMDPQLRLLLQSVYATGEDAGVMGRLRGTGTGVFVGVCCHDYLERINELGLPIDPYVGLGNNHTVLANRISFALDLRGPSVAVDTACSSSLVALHQACQALRGGECDMAFVGGVNLLLSSQHYRFFSSVGALSPTGRCHTFDASADGYVPGEFVGSVLLKPLRRALEDGDRIHAVIKGSASLHGGYTPSFTAPSVAGEESVVVKAWEDAGIDPETITYIEAHGTGTKLGDPIEMKALSQAFGRFTSREGFCAVGSVKANIGHTEGAAGFAGLLKVVLQMRHRRIPALPSLQTPNELIKWDGTALRPASENEEWASAEGAPRRAGISSFGISGAYAHVVVEEYVPGSGEAPAVARRGGQPVAVVLSAKDEDRLREHARRLADALRDLAFGDDDLPAIAYTLQTGREALRNRMGVVVRSVSELEAVLRAFGAGQDDERVHRERVDAAGQPDVDSAGRASTGPGEPAHEHCVRLVAGWVSGETTDWEALYDTRPAIVSLPTYPFARERYWIPADATGPATDQPARPLPPTDVPAHHPLLHTDVSDDEGPRFRATFSGEEFFLAEHEVKGRRILPGAAYLEMVREAVRRSGQASDPSGESLRLEDVVWLAPIEASGPVTHVEVVLTPADVGEAGRLDFAVYTRTGQLGEQAVLHCQGSAVPLTGDGDGSARVDLDAVRAGCDAGRLTADQCYETFRAAEMEYGPAFQGIEYVLGGATQALAKLTLPLSVRETGDAYVLHPSLLDSALQASVGLRTDPSGLGEPVMPFALESVDVLGRCSPSMWARVRLGEGTTATSTLRKFDVDLCDADGTVCVRIAGASSRAWKDGRQQTGAGDIETITAVPVWDTVRPAGEIHDLPGPGRAVIVGGDPTAVRKLARTFPEAQPLVLAEDDTVDRICAQLRACGPIAHLMWTAPAPAAGGAAWDATPRAQETGVIQLFRIVKALLALDYGHRDLLWTVVTVQAQATDRAESADPTHAGVHGLVGSLAKEYPDWFVRAVDLPMDEEWPAEELRHLPSTGSDVYAWRGTQWRRRKLVALQGAAPGRRTGYRHGGVYVVIGGAGGIGEAWTEYMIKTYRAQVVWIGRRESDRVIERKIDRLASFGPAPVYIRADGADEAELRGACETVRWRFGTIHGVVHSALSLRDQSLAQMTEERFRAGYTGKLDVSVRMAQVFADEELDFVLFFSSVISFTKAAGQANYAAGCTFKDAFADRLAREWACPVKVMNWGYWGSVGVVASAAYRERMEREGIGSIEPDEAMRALELLLSSPFDQLALVKAAPDRVDAIDTSETVTVYPGAGDPDHRGQTPPDVLERLRDLANTQIGGGIQSSDEERQLSDYGFSPAALTALAARVGDEFRINLPQAIFIDYPTLGDLAGFLAASSGSASMHNGAGRGR